MTTPQLIESADGSFSIKGLEVFRSGEYGDKGTFCDADIAKLAASYDPKTKHEAPITVDHTKGGPAYGWVESVKASGDTLIADIVRIPAEFAEELKKGAWKKRSAEIYTDLEGSGLYLKAVTFLGAQAPHVKGMADWTFKTDAPATHFVFVESTKPTVALFSRPTGADAGVIRFCADAQEILGHSHKCVLDDANNGWTDFDSFGATHQHVIINGQVQAAKDANGIEHTHEVVNAPKIKAFATNPSEESAMEANTTKPDDAAKMACAEKKMADGSPELDALKAEIASLRAENEAIKAQLAKESEMAEAAKFDAAFDKAVAIGAVVPADRATELAIFSAIPAKAEATIAFADGKKATPREAYLAGMIGRPAKSLTTELIKPTFTGGTATFADADPSAKSAADAKKADAYIRDQAAKGQKVNFTDACRALAIPIK